MKALTVIGRAEKAAFLDIGVDQVPVKIDTGADACSIWANVTELANGHIRVVFFGEGSEWYTGEAHEFTRSEYKRTRIANSFGHKEVRYKVKLRVKLKGRIIRGSFTLADRSDKTYPVLIGCSLLRNKFIVDVSQGDLIKADKQRAKKVKKEADSMGEEL